MKVLSLFVAMFFGVGSLQAQGLPSHEHIIISGSGFVKAMPDYIRIELTVRKTSKTLKLSKDYVDKITQQLIAAALERGVVDEDIGASKIQARPEYKWIKDENKYLGEKVSRSITLLLRDMSQYSALVQAIIDAGVTTLDGVQLQFSDRDKLERESMALAIQNAKAKAKVIADQFGANLGEVYKISEAPINDIRYYQADVSAMRVELSAGGDRAEFKIRKQRVIESVYVVFYLES